MNPQGKRSRGRPRGSWRRVREKDMERIRTWPETKKLDQNREWKSIRFRKAYNDKDNDKKISH